MFKITFSTLLTKLIPFPQWWTMGCLLLIIEITGGLIQNWICCLVGESYIESAHRTPLYILSIAKYSVCTHPATHPHCSLLPSAIWQWSVVASSEPSSTLDIMVKATIQAILITGPLMSLLSASRGLPWCWVKMETTTMSKGVSFLNA